MPKIDVNGVIREMTPEEIQALEAEAKNHEQSTSQEGRIAELEKALAMLLSGVTE